MSVENRKVLLIGELSEIVRSLNECMEEDFLVQVCPAQMENVKYMYKIAKPDIVVCCQIGIDEVDGAIFEWLKYNCGKTPIIIITSQEGWKQCKPYCEDGNFDKLFRPVLKDDILNKCYQLLGLPGRVTKRERRPVDFSKKKILIVDDNPVLLRNTKGILEEEYEVFVATSGELGLKMVFSKQPDLVLLDYEMPGMNGKEMFEKMLEDDFAKEIPVIFLSYIDDKNQIYAVLKSTPAGYILKPPDKDRLLAEIREVLG